MRLLDSVPLRSRLTLVYGVWMAVLLPAAGWGLYALVERNLMQSVDAALTASAQAMLDTKIKTNDPLMAQLLADVLGERHVNATARIVDLSGKVRMRVPRGDISLPMTHLATERAEHGLTTFETFERRDKPPFRLLTVPLIYDSRFAGDVVQVGASLETTQTALREIGTVLWISFPVALALSLGFGFYLAGKSLGPVNALQEAAASLGARDLATRLPLPVADDELRRLTKTFNSMIDRLEDAFGRLRRFSSDVSHELRTPLAAIRGEADFALRRERTTEDYQHSLKSIQQESLHMTKIVEDLLLLARAESRSVAFNPEEVEPSSVLEDAAAGVKAFFVDHNVPLEVENLITGPIRCVPGYLNLAIGNLLNNAAKHSPIGTPVKLIAEKRSGWNCFDVIDGGEGIPEEEAKRIFDPFYRIDSARNRRVGGAGIGLSLAMALTRMHGGDIVVKSQPGSGSIFTLRIPSELSTAPA